MEIQRRRTPEEEELHRKQAELSALETQVADRELELATLRAELGAFEHRYLTKVGARYAELDEILAQIAETEARLRPQDESARRTAEASRNQADETARAARTARESKHEKHFHPSDALKKLFREAAKAMHPDLAENEEDSPRRHRFMSEANRAYEEGDENRLRAILDEWKASPDAVKGQGVGADLVRTIRKIAKLHERLRAIEIEIRDTTEGELFNLKSKVEDAESNGRDLLEEIVARLNREIAEARQRMTALQREAG